LGAAALLFELDRSVFLLALHVAPDKPLSHEARASLEQLGDALCTLRRIVPDEVLPRWVTRNLPNHYESPLDILKGEDGFREFLRLIESINHGDFA
jgi:hypothetical protein